MAKHRLPRRHRVVRAVRTAPGLVRRPAVAAPLAVLVSSGAMVAAMSATLTGQPQPPANAAAEVSTSDNPVELPELPARAPEQVDPAATTLASYADYAQAAADIPDAALMAYQRAASVMAQAAPECHLEWSLLAAIGRVASDHGGTDVAAAALVDGPRRTLPDTDGGALDGDAAHDVPVGPLQLLPATWTVVAVDGDNDGTRDADDLDDASLAAGVVLCGNDRDLDSERDLREALRMFNTAPRYPSVVARLAATYARNLGAGAVPDTLLAMGPPAPSSSTTTASDPSQSTDGTPDATQDESDGPWSDGPGNGGGPDDEVTSMPSDKPTDKDPDPTPDETDPTDPTDPETTTATDCASPTAEPTDEVPDGEASPSASLTPCTSSATSPTESSTPSTAGPSA